MTGIYCAGCGSQRALHQLLHLNFKQMLDYNALFALGFFVILYNFSIKAINHLFNKEYYNYIYHPKTPMIIGVFVILFWILRNIDMYPFSILAP